MESIAQLKAGHWVKIKGDYTDGAFTALGITVKSDRGYSALIGKITDLTNDPSSCLILGRAMQINNETSLLNIESETTSFDHLKIGAIAKAKGEFHKDKGMCVTSLECREARGFDKDQIQGTIDAVNVEKGEFYILGIPVQVDKLTEIKGF